MEEQANPYASLYSAPYTATDLSGNMYFTTSTSSTPLAQVSVSNTSGMLSNLYYNNTSINSRVTIPEVEELKADVQTLRAELDKLKAEKEQLLLDKAKSVPEARKLNA